MQRFHRFAIASVVLLTSACSKTAGEASSENSEAETPKRAPMTAQLDLCGLVTQAEAEAILDTKLNAPQKQSGGDCWYLREGGTDFGAVEFMLSTITGQVTSAAEFDAFVASSVKNMNDKMNKKGLSMVAFTAEPAPDVGAPAYFIDPGLYVYKGNAILAVGLGGAKGVAIAKTALARMP